MSTRKAQLLKRIAGKKGRSTALTEEEKALRAIGDAIENGELGGGNSIVIRGEGYSVKTAGGYTVPEGTFETVMNNLYHGTIPNIVVQFLMPGSGNAVIAYAGVATNFHSVSEGYDVNDRLEFDVALSNRTYQFELNASDTITTITEAS